MFSEVEFTRDVSISGDKHLQLQSLSTLHHQILSTLLQDLLREKACREVEHGFYLAITALKSIGNNTNDHHQEHVLTYPVSFTCRTFLPAKGDILQGTVIKVLWDRVFITSGPLNYVYLPPSKLPGYQYFESESENEKPFFGNTKIAAGVVVRFKVVAVQFKEKPKKNEFYTVATMEDNDDTLGPVSLTGSDAPYM